MQKKAEAMLRYLYLPIYLGILLLFCWTVDTVTVSELGVGSFNSKAQPWVSVSSLVIKSGARGGLRISQWRSAVLHRMRQTQDCRTAAPPVNAPLASLPFRLLLGGRAQIFEVASGAGFQWVCGTPSE